MDAYGNFHVEDFIDGAIEALRRDRTDLAMNHLREAQHAMKNSQHSWKGDRDDRNALWYRLVPCSRPAEPI